MERLANALRENSITQYMTMGEIDNNRTEYLLSFKLKDVEHLQKLLSVFTRTKALRCYEYRGCYYLLALWLYVKENDQFVFKPMNAIKVFSDFYTKIQQANGYPKVLLNPAHRSIPCPGTQSHSGCGKSVSIGYKMPKYVNDERQIYGIYCVCYNHGEFSISYT